MDWTELISSDIKGAIFSLSMIKMAKPIPMILMVNLIVMGLKRGHLGCWMVDPLPLEGDKVGQIRKT